VKMVTEKMIVVALIFCLIMQYKQHTNILSSIVSPWDDTLDGVVARESNKKLRLYLHVGPGKMATTTIQDALATDKVALNEDGYCIFDPIKMRRQIGPMLNHERKTFQGNDAWDSFVFFLDHCVSLQQNVILSSEYLGDVDERIWKKYMQPAFSQFDFHVVVGYRRYYQWLPSVHFQIFRNFIKLEKSIPSVPEFVMKNKAATVLYTDNYLDHWKSLVGDDFQFHVYNMHEDRNVMKTLYCKMLPDTGSACRKYSHHSFPSKNEGYTLEYDRLVIAAKDLNVIPEGTNSLAKASSELTTIHQMVMNMTLKDFPVVCLDDEEFVEVLKKSLEFEKKLVPTWFSSENGESAIQLEFKHYAENKLCSVDVTKVVKDEKYSEMWKTLLHQLDEIPHPNPR
jgi:hypothetical protein